MSSESTKCPFQSNPPRGRTNADWWPQNKKLNLKLLEQNPICCQPYYYYGCAYDYEAEFSKLNLEDLKRDVMKLMTTSNDTFWPADYGHYGPLFIRLAWHSAGTYRVFDGKGGGNNGNIRLPPLNSWPDNANLDKALRLLWPLKQKYGKQISWSDLIIFVGNCALESMGCTPIGFGGGRLDLYQPEDEAIYWGSEQVWLQDNRHKKHTATTTTATTGLEEPLSAVQMGLIYVNPEGPERKPKGDILESAKDIRETFKRMGMNDIETVALIAGGHTFGKAHGAADPSKYVGKEPEGATLTSDNTAINTKDGNYLGLGWKNTYQTGKGEHTITSGLEGAWTYHPTKWDHDYFTILFKYKTWKRSQSPAGALQWIPSEEETKGENQPKIIMFTTDLALIYDPDYQKISYQFYKDPQYFQNEFVKAWYKLTHRDMGPKQKYLGSYVPRETFLWQDPLPPVSGPIINRYDVIVLKKMILSSGLTLSQLVFTAFSSACTYRNTDFRGGANGARLRLEPQKHWPVNRPNESQSILSRLQSIQDQFNHSSSRKVSLADVIVLGGCTALEQAIKNNSEDYDPTVPFYPGRTDASQDETDIESFQYLEPKMDIFRNYFGTPGNRDPLYSPEETLIDQSYKLTLSVVEMTVLIGGLRVLNCNTDPQSQVGVFTKRETTTLSNDYFIHVLDNNIVWYKQSNEDYLFVGKDSQTQQPLFVGSTMDLLFGSHSQLRCISEVYASSDGKQKFIQDFVTVWNKIMNLDRFDLQKVKNIHDPTTIIRSSTHVSKL